MIQVFVVNYADTVALPGLYANESALLRGFDPDFHAIIADAAKVAAAHPGEPVDIMDGDQLIYQTVTEAPSDKLRIMVLTDGETFSGLDGCAIFDVPADLETEDIETLLADDIGDGLELVQRFTDQ